VHQPRHSLPLSKGAHHTKTPIKIDVLAPLSGPLAALARDIVDGALLYVDEVNGEMVGSKVELIVPVRLLSWVCQPGGVEPGAVG
jgi:ABC-type branched-subunit amino acid transport system substrate-binding protein